MKLTSSCDVRKKNVEWKSLKNMPNKKMTISAQTWAVLMTKGLKKVALSLVEKVPARGKAKG